MTTVYFKIKKQNIINIEANVLPSSCPTFLMKPSYKVYSVSLSLMSSHGLSYGFGYSWSEANCTRSQQTQLLKGWKTQSFGNRWLSSDRAGAFLKEILNVEKMGEEEKWRVRDVQDSLKGELSTRNRGREVLGTFEMWDNFRRRKMRKRKI